MNNDKAFQKMVAKKMREIQYSEPLADPEYDPVPLC